MPFTHCSAHSTTTRYDRFILSTYTLARNALTGRFTVDWSLLASISANIVTEEAPSTTSTPQTGGDVDDDCAYTLEMLTERLEMAAQMLCKVRCISIIQLEFLPLQAERRESLGPLYRLITPAYEQRHDYAALVHAYSRLQQVRSSHVQKSDHLLLQSYDQVRACVDTGRHALPLHTYFRVAFYGQVTYCH